MRTYVKSIFWIAGGAGVLLGLLIMLLLLAPFLVNLEPVKQKIVIEFSREIGGAMEARRIDLLLFPRPSVTFRGGKISIPEELSGTFDSLSIHPEVLPLVRGKIRLARLIIEAPDIQMNLPERNKPEHNRIEGMQQFSPQAIGDGLASLTAKAARRAPGLTVSIKKGSLTLRQQSEQSFHFHDIDAQVGLPGERLEIEVACTSNVWKHASFVGWFEPGSARSEGHLQLTQLRFELIARNLSPLIGSRVEDSQVNLELTFSADGAESFQAQLRSDVPNATLRNGKQTLTLKNVSLKGTFSRRAGVIAASLTQLDSAYPELTISGNFSADPALSRASVELHSGKVELESLRRTFLFLGGRVPIVRSISEILEKGRVTELSVASHGRSISELINVENIVIQGNLAQGKIVLPEPYFEFEDVKGNGFISHGILEGKNIEARLVTARGRDGLLKIDLKPDIVPFHVDIAVEADLSHLPFYLERLVEDEVFIGELNLVSEIQGNGSGRLFLDRRTRETKVKVDVNAFTLKALYQRFPYPLEVNGRFSYDETTGRIILEGASGKAGKSSFSGFSGELSLDETHRLTVSSGAGTFLLDEMYPWILSFPSLKDDLQGLGPVKGILRVDSLKTGGLLLQPATWQFEIAGRPENIAMAPQWLPGTVEVNGGKFEAGPERFSCSDFDVRAQDASLTVSGIVNRYLDEPDRADLSLRGEMGEQSVQWVSDFIHLPHEINIRSPLSLTEAHLLWEKNGKTAFSGNLNVKHGPEVAVDVVSEREDLVIKHLAIRDAKSDASMILHPKAKEFDFTFSGTLDGKTLDTLLQENRLLTGWIKGNLSSRIDLDHPYASVAQGTLQGAGLKYPGNAEVPVSVQAFSLNATGKRFALESDFLALGQKLGAKGTVNILADGFMFDMDVSADGVDVNRIIAQAQSQGDESFWALPLKGVLRIRSEYVKYGKFTWRPVRADLTLRPKIITIGITKADLCGIDNPGLLEVSPEGLRLHTKLKATDQDLRETLVCLWDYKDISGHFSFDGEVTGEGKAEALLLRSLKDKLAFEAKNGRIYRFELLAKIFQVISPTGIFRIPDLRKEGFPYSGIKANANLHDGKIAIKEGIVYSPSTNLIFSGEVDVIDWKIDAVVLVSPFTILDRIISFIPGVNYLMSGRLVAIPVKVTGDLADPTVFPFSPSAVGADLLGSMKRILNLPLKLIQPLLPGEEKK